MRFRVALADAASMRPIEAAIFASRQRRVHKSHRMAHITMKIYELFSQREFISVAAVVGRVCNCNGDLADCADDILPIIRFAPRLTMCRAAFRCGRDRTHTHTFQMCPTKSNRQAILWNRNGNYFCFVYKIAIYSE